MDEFQTIARPGYYGKNRDKVYEMYDKIHGKDNWRVIWRWEDKVVPFESACKIYEDAYLNDSFENEVPWILLYLHAKDVYDIEERDVESGLDYLVQKGGATHIQDIAIRNVLSKRGFKFSGNELIQVRKHDTYWGNMFSPGRMPFHLPERIVRPHLVGWWDENSVEDFYQSNKVLQAKVNL